MPEKNAELPQMLVRGISLISLSDYVKSRLKKDEVRDFFARLPKADSIVIQSAQKWKWYPFFMQRHLREEIANRFNPENPRAAVYDAGLFAATQETSTFLKAMLGFFSPGIVLKNSNVIWRKYYKSGKLRGTLTDDSHGIVELTGFSSDPIFCPMVQSWLVVSAKALKLKDAKVTETACIHNDDKVCRWTLAWNSDTPAALP